MSNKFSYIGIHLKTGEVVGPFTNPELQSHGFNTYNVRQVVFGNRVSHGGYTWKREEIES